MITTFIKIIFLLITICILIYCASYAKFEIKNKNKICSGISVFLFSFFCIIFSNIMFWIA